MASDELLDGLAEILEQDRAALTEETALADLNWDSLAFVSFIAMVDSRFGVTVPLGNWPSAARLRIWLRWWKLWSRLHPNEDLGHRAAAGGRPVMVNPMDLTGRLILVTGASAGIGRPSR